MGTFPPGGEQEKVRSTIMQLSELTDLIGLEAFIEKRTDWGRKPGTEPWQYTREALRTYSPSSNPDELIRLFEGVDVHSDIEALRWIIRHDKLIP
jgi:hypothetical protein